MNKSHMESIFNSMINDVAYIKLATYELKDKKYRHHI